MKKVFNFLVIKKFKLIVFFLFSLLIISISLIFSNTVKNSDSSDKKSNALVENDNSKMNYNEIKKGLEKYSKESTINFINLSAKKLSNLIEYPSTSKKLNASYNFDDKFYSNFLIQQNKLFNFFKDNDYNLEQIQAFNREKLINKNDFLKKMDIDDKINTAISYIKESETNHFNLYLKNNFRMISNSKTVYERRNLVKILRISKNSIDLAAGLLSVTSAALWAAAPWTFGATVFAAVLATSSAAILWAASTAIQVFITHYDPDISNSEKIGKTAADTLLSSLYNVLGSAISYFGVLMGFKTTVDSISNLVNELR